MASDYAYMSSPAGEPWGSPSNLTAMNAVFGNNWERINFGDTIDNYKFVYLDGGDDAGAAFYSYVQNNQASLENFVLGGGRLFLNVASNAYQSTPHNLIFGATATEMGIGYSAFGYAVDPTNPLFEHAGKSWRGNYFAHDAIGTAAGFSTLITGDQGQSILEAGSFGNGYVMLGGQTSTNFHYSVDGSNPLQLRMNELSLAANVAIVVASPVPEPETYAMMMAGLLLVAGVVARRRTGQAEKPGRD